MISQDTIKLLGKLKNSASGGQAQAEWILRNKEILMSQIAAQTQIESVAPLSQWSLYKEVFQQIVFSKQVLQPVLSLSLLVLAVFGVNAVNKVSANSLPGDWLYPIKIFNERTQLVFTAQEDKAGVRLQFINNRLEELTQVSQQPQVNQQQVKNVVNSIISETKSVQQDLNRVASTTSQSTAVDVARAVQDQTNTTNRTVSQVTQQLSEQVQQQISGNLQQLLEVNNSISVKSQGIIAAANPATSTPSTATSTETTAGPATSTAK